MIQAVIYVRYWLYNPAQMIEVILNDRVGRKIRVKCNSDDTILDLKKLVAAQTG